MSESSPLAAYFAHMSNSGGIIVQEQPKLDLDLYIQNYAAHLGRTRIERLIHIGKSSVPLCIDALKAAIAEIKKGSDVALYVDAWGCLRLAAPDDPDAQKDQAWIDRVERENKTEAARLETQLKQYKHNLIKESIRMGNEDLGLHFEKTGYLEAAAEAYNRMRQDVTTTKHIIDCGIHLVNVYIARRDWTMVLNNLGKIVGVQSGEEERLYQPYTKLVSGIALLGLKHYKDAAYNFLQVDFTIPPAQYNHIASPNDIAIYGGLLTLATMDRHELQARVLDSQSFRSFLEHESHIRKAISLFVNGRYSSCLAILESIRNDCLLDIYLQRHVPALYSQIRRKCIVQYFRPFSCVTLESLNQAFAQEGESVDTELVSMIREGILKARLDIKEQLLIADQPNPRLEMQKQALEVATQYEEEAKERLRRISLIAAGLEVAGRAKGPGLGGRGIDEEWYGEGKALGQPGAVEG
ncbi:COP9 signalosome complex subunit 1 (G pathway suppressor 1) [Fusarium napiforme]|uniref:COP9 signalosome complex subunit 1 (G pathway suppressor 1) n=1 Tax=Fusarium napiforme TaxID=42672 RepID=A0A8H5NIH7_9HYPO|nr:COP9 signalosome complex subunit 1 (G pathway suppressor 1) [Fusarium napiforme]